MILIDVTLATSEPQRTSLVALLRETATGSLAEEGCLVYRATSSLDDPLQFHLVELWETEKAYQDHREGQPFARFLERLPDAGRIVAVERRAGSLAPYAPVQA
jgi:quinol monooxygenase YgiN